MTSRAAPGVARLLPARWTAAATLSRSNIHRSVARSAHNRCRYGDGSMGVCNAERLLFYQRSAYGRTYAGTGDERGHAGRYFCIGSLGALSYMISIGGHNQWRESTVSEA